MSEQLSPALQAALDRALAKSVAVAVAPPVAIAAAPSPAAIAAQAKEARQIEMDRCVAEIAGDLSLLAGITARRHTMQREAAEDAAAATALAARNAEGAALAGRILAA